MTETIEPSKRKVKCTKCDWKGTIGQSSTFKVEYDVGETCDIHICPICRGYVIADFEGGTWPDADKDVSVEFCSRKHEIIIRLPETFIPTAEEKEAIKEEVIKAVELIMRLRR